MTNREGRKREGALQLTQSWRAFGLVIFLFSTTGDRGATVGVWAFSTIVHADNAHGYNRWLNTSTSECSNSAGTTLAESLASDGRTSR